MAAHIEPVLADRDGFVTRLEARAVGIAAWRLGAGRARKEDPVSAAAGIVCLAKEGDRVSAGQPVMELHTDDPERFVRAREALSGAMQIGDMRRLPRPWCWTGSPPAECGSSYATCAVEDRTTKCVASSTW